MSSDGTEYYKYHPSLAAATVFAALFAISTILHTYQLFRTRTWYMIPVVLGGFCEWIGYVGRALNAHEAPEYHLAPFILQAILLLIAAVLFAASIYMELGHIILLIGGDHHSVIRKKLLTPLFVCGDIFSFLVQSTGSSSTGEGPNVLRMLTASDRRWSPSQERRGLQGIGEVDRDWRSRFATNLLRAIHDFLIHFSQSCQSHTDFEISSAGYPVA